jgi:methionyl-tRNA synthetase
VPESPAGKRETLDTELERQLARAIERVAGNFESFQITVALQDTWDLIRSVNQYIVKREPWSLAKRAEAKDTLNVTLYHSADALRVTAALIDPVMPDAAGRIRKMLGIAQESWQGLRAGALAPGTRLGPTEPLFPRIDKTVEELRTMSASDPREPTAPSAASPPSADPRITIDDFMKIELRVAKVLEAEAVPKSKKLLRLKVDTGHDQRTIVAGIAEAYQPEQLVGRTIVIVANLQPAKLMGIESNGMVLAASVEGGAPMLVGFDQEVAPGARVR